MPEPFFRGVADAVRRLLFCLAPPCCNPQTCQDSRQEPPTIHDRDRCDARATQAARRCDDDGEGGERSGEATVCGGNYDVTVGSYVGYPGCPTQGAGGTAEGCP